MLEVDKVETEEEAKRNTDVCRRTGMNKSRRRTDRIKPGAEQRKRVSGTIQFSAGSHFLSPTQLVV